MSDIVERLQEFEGRPDQNEYALISEAADEIERLRAALQEIKVLSWATPEGHHIQDIARRALEGNAKQ